MLPLIVVAQCAAAPMDLLAQVFLEAGHEAKVDQAGAPAHPVCPAELFTDEIEAWLTTMSPERADGACARAARARGGRLCCGDTSFQTKYFATAADARAPPLSRADLAQSLGGELCARPAFSNPVRGARAAPRAAQWRRLRAADPVSVRAPQLTESYSVNDDSECDRPTNTPNSRRKHAGGRVKVRGATRAPADRLSAAPQGPTPRPAAPRATRSRSSPARRARS